MVNTTHQHGLASTPNPHQHSLVTDNPFVRLSQFFTALANIFADPKVQEAGTQLFAAVDEAMDRELPTVTTGRHSQSLPTGRHE